jgi:hypothetical protein
VIFSLFTSWIIFSELTGKISQSDSRLCALKKRVGLACIRLQTCLLFVLFPAATVILIRDLEPYLSTLNDFEKSAACGALFLILAAGLPLLLLTICSHGNFKDSILENQIKTIFIQNRINLRKIRIWRTGNQVANAAVVGIIPRFRMLLLSDKLLNLFPQNELLAIVKHEAGHVMLWHTFTRLGFLSLPILAIAQQQTQLAEMPFPHLEGGLQELADTAIPFFPCGIYLAFLLITLPWLSHQMEHEADIFACQSKGLRKSEGDAESSADLKCALLRLAALAPGNYERQSLFHPSLERRIELIEKIERSPRKIDQFKRSFSRRRILVLICFSLTWIFMTLI